MAADDEDAAAKLTEIPDRGESPLILSSLVLPPLAELSPSAWLESANELEGRVTERSLQLPLSDIEYTVLISFKSVF